MLTYSIGELATLSVSFSLNGTPTDPTTPLITIYNGSTVIIGPTALTKVSTGYYNYVFAVPDTWTPDLYSVVYTGTMGGIDFKQSEDIRVVPQESITGTTVPTDTYCEVADVQKELSGIDLTQLDNYSSLIAEEIYNRESDLHAITGRTMKKITETIWLDGLGTPYLLLPNPPIRAIESINIRVSPGIDWCTFTSAANQIALLNPYSEIGETVAVTSATPTQVNNATVVGDIMSGRLYISERVVYAQVPPYPIWNYTFVNGKNNIKVVYTHGYEQNELPRRLKMLMAKMVARQILIEFGDLLSEGMASFNVDGYGRSFGSIPFQGRLERLEDDIEKLSNAWNQLGVS